MKKFEFSLTRSDSLILVDVLVNRDFTLSLALDTGATHSTFDRTALLMAEVELKDIISKRLIETSGGFVETEVYEFETFEAFEHKVENFRVQVYDFLAMGILPEYDGVLGLDFLQQKDLCIHFSKGYLTFH